ncbi:MAG: hypothetical protein WDA08_03360 [Weeksellaceae bacterium]
MKEIVKPTMTNTKKEILEAYEELLKTKTETKQPKEMEVLKQKAETIKAATGFSPESVVKGLANIKLEIANSIDKIEEGLLQEFQKLEKLQKAIRFETENLEDLYGIRANADSLSVLIAANKAKKEEFDAEMTLRKSKFDEDIKNQQLIWEKEQKERNERWKEEDEIRKKNIKREEEEYQYNLSLTRKKEEDTYQNNKETQERVLAEMKTRVEKELNDREKTLMEREAELEELKSKVAEFPTLLNKEIEQAKRILTEQLTTQFKFEKELYEKENVGEIRLLQHTITSLEGKIKEQEQLIASLNRKSDTASEQVQSIAIKALESASAYRKEDSKDNVEKRE